MNSTLFFWLVLGGASLTMLGVSRLTLYSLKPGSRPILRIVLAHLIAVAVIAVIGGFDMPFLAGATRWVYALALAGFGTLPWLAMDIVRARPWLSRGSKPPPPLRGPPPPRGEET